MVLVWSLPQQSWAAGTCPRHTRVGGWGLSGMPLQARGQKPHGACCCQSGPIPNPLGPGASHMGVTWPGSVVRAWLPEVPADSHLVAASLLCSRDNLWVLFPPPQITTHRVAHKSSSWTQSEHPYESSTQTEKQIVTSTVGLLQTETNQKQKQKQKSTQEHGRRVPTHLKQQPLTLPQHPPTPG